MATSYFNLLTMTDDSTIPGPPGLPLLGNAADIDANFPLGSFLRFADLYGPIYRMHIGGQPRTVIGSQALMNEVCDEKRFSKSVSAALEQVRNGVHDGLFTAYGPQEENWGLAHRILLPAFGPVSIRNMFDEMHDIASQLVMKWARHGPDYVIPVTDDFTRLTLDTLALCAMNYRFNSYYRDELHPFIAAMGDFLVESGNRSRRPGIAQMFYRHAQQQYDDDIALLRKTSDDVVKARRAHPSDRKDLLNAMLNGKDPKTGQTLSDQSITDNLITFLIAGHETTSGMLSFAFYYLLKNPAAYQRAQQEVDEVIGTGPITVDHLSKVPYLNAILRETLRVLPCAPMISLEPLEDETIGGKYKVGKGEPIVALLPKVHRDPAVYGPDADEWKPERMLDENFERMNKEFPNCWKPFGNGMRGCIGRPFAWQEALLVLAMLLQNFNFSLHDSSYNLAFKQTLTIKPKDFYMRATLRNSASPTHLEQSLLSKSVSGTPGTVTPVRPTESASKAAPGGKKMAIYYGSNTGTCEALAQRLASDAPSHGFRAEIVDTLDCLKENFPDTPVAILTASYEGQPADNAAHFVTWLESLKGKEMEKVSYSVFGCGHHDWATTFYRIPKLVDNLMAERGGQRIAPIGTADAAAGDIFTDFEAWEDKVFWPAMKEKFGGEDSIEGLDLGLTVEVSAPRASTLRQDVKQARVVSTKVLSAPGAPEKRHVEVQLPSDMSYSSGDYLAVLPLNPKENIQRAINYFGLAWDSMLTISSSGHTNLPVDAPISVSDLLGAYVELAQPASRRNVKALINATDDKETKSKLEKISEDEFASEISAKRVSVLDLLEKYPKVHLPLPAFLQMLPPMRIRQYSISSSPLWNPTNVTLTYAVLDQPAMSGVGRHIGVASSYLASLKSGDQIHVSIKQSHQAFHLPSDAENIPIIMIASGTGLAPFRGFVQERAAQVGAGRNLAPALLFFGCRTPDSDDLYAEEFARWEKIGAVDIRRAYSRASDKSNGCKYVQDRVWADRKDVMELWDKDAKIFVCGSSAVGEGVRETCLKIVMETHKERKDEELTRERAEAWFDSIRNDRFSTDVFA